MKTRKLDVVQVWKQFEDVLTPRLGLSPIERAVYLHLLRHSHLEGKRRLCFSLIWLGRNLGLSRTPVRNAVHRLDELRALHILERSKAGHVVEMRLPSGAGIEQIDFTKTYSLRLAIHARDGRRCFYCLRQTPGRMHCLDHVVPRARSGRSSYRNLVSCCMECNSAKGDIPAPDFLRCLYREGRLTAADFRGRLRVLKQLTAGKLCPVLSHPEDPGSTKQGK